MDLILVRLELGSELSGHPLMITSELQQQRQRQQQQQQQRQ